MLSRDTGARKHEMNSGCHFLNESHCPWLIVTCVTFTPLLSKIFAPKLELLTYRTGISHLTAARQKSGQLVLL